MSHTRLLGMGTITVCSAMSGARNLKGSDQPKYTAPASASGSVLTVIAYSAP